MILKSDNIRPIFEGYIEDRLLDITNSDKMFNEIKYWDNISLDIFSNKKFKELINKKTVELLLKSGNVIESGKKINNFYANFIQSSKDALQREKLRQFAEPILSSTEEYVYRNIDLDKITMNDINNLSLSIRRREAKFEIIQYIDGLIHGGHEFDKYSIFRKDYEVEVKELIKRLYQSSIEYKNYTNIILGFITVLGMSSFAYAFHSMIKYIYSKGNDEVYKFILWSFEEDIFSSSVNFDEYLESIRYHFIKYDRGAFKNKEVKKTLYSTKSRILIKLFKELELKLANPVVRFFVKYKRQMVLGILTTGLVCAIAIGGYKLVGVVFQNKISQKPSITNSISKTESLKISIRKRIADVINKTVLDGCTYIVKCEVQGNEKVYGPTSAIIVYVDSESNLDTDIITVKGEETYKAYKLNYSILITKKKSINIKDNKESKNLENYLKRAVIEGIKLFIDNEIVK